jgi:glutathione synthase/RimK-type ligase-like ATP-grasp enzyme
MILVVTHKFDFTADFLIQKLNERDIPYYRLNCEDISIHTEISLSSKSNFAPVIDGKDKFSVVWFRRTKLPELERIDPYVQAYYLSELKWFQRNLWNTIDARWISEPDSVYRAENKFLQLKTARQIGFIIPPTLISTNVNEINKFFEECEGQLIIKPIYNNRFEFKNGSQLIYTTKISKVELEELLESMPLPSIYQKYVEKKREIRVTVINDAVFAASVDSQQSETTKVDWRRERLPFTSYNLPQMLQNKCIEIVKALNLSFGAIDLIETPEGEYVFLEINPNGQWAWIEMDTGLPISDSIIDFFKKCED